MEGKSSQETPNKIEERISGLTSKIRDDYGKFYDELTVDDQMLWNGLFHLANIEKGQSSEKREVLVKSLESFLGFLESEYRSKDK